ncbi:MAG: serine/threonine-protein kinase [Thermoleophilia bacterium]
MSAVAASSEHPRHGLILGRYRPIRPLGAGGSASVWLATDEVDGREVALKIVPREGRAAERAEREARAVARLAHPNCARVYAIARDHDHVYVVYEYIPGRTFREALRTHALRDSEVVEAAAQVLDALGHAHAKGIVHRDVKPANVVLRDGERVDARLLDFGLAQIEDATSITGHGDVPGTLAYISPERLDGAEATWAADVWSVGVVLWEGLAGRHPFLTSSASEMAERIERGAPPLAEERPDLPRRLVQAVDRALAADPRERPRPADLARELRGAVSRRREERRPHQRTLGRRHLVDRAAHGVGAAAFGWLALHTFPFLPASFTLPVALLAGLVAFARPRLGLALALAVPVLPLGDVSSGLAVVYGVCAAGWLALQWRDAERGLAFVAGPFLALAGALALVPLLALRSHGAARRALTAAVAALTGIAYAGLEGRALPFTGQPAPRGLGIDGSGDPTAVAGALERFLVGHASILAVVCVLAAAAAAAPLVARLGLRAAVAFAAALPATAAIGPLVIGDSGVELLPLVGSSLVVGLAVVAGPLVERARSARARAAVEELQEPSSLAAGLTVEDPSLEGVWGSASGSREAIL